MRKHAWWVAVALVAGCGGSTKVVEDHAVAPPDAASVVVDAPAPVVVAPTFPGAPDTLAGRQLAWLLDGIVTRHGALTEAEVTAHFAPSFLAAVPPATFLGLAKQLSAGLAGATITKVEGVETTVVAHLAAGTEKLTMTVQVDPATKLVTGALVRADESAGPRPKSWAEVETMLPTIAPHAQLLVAALDAKGACKPLHEHNSKTPEALGSAFKLYVLLGLADQIAAGKLTWDQTVAVRDDWKSLPSGITQDDPAGTALSLETLATRMISISDNTATDHVLYTVGRTTVEAELKAAKHSKPALDIPFISTRDMFLLKLVATPAENAAYLKMTPAKRRAYLDTAHVGKTVPLDTLGAWTGARQIDTLEWFASPVDMCNALGALYVRGQKPATAKVMEVLAKNPGLPIDKAKFPYIGFKGGSEPGVMTLQYLLQRADGKWFVVSSAFNSDAGGTVDQGKVIGLAEGVVDLVAEEK